MIENDLEKTKSPSKNAQKRAQKDQSRKQELNSVKTQQPVAPVKKTSKKKSKDDEDSDVINTTSGPATQLFKKQISDDKSSIKRPKNASTNPRITKDAP